MSNMNKVVVWLIGIMVLSLITGSIVFATTGGFDGEGEKNKQIIDERETFDIEDVSKLDIDTISSDVTFIPTTDTDEIVVHYHGKVTKFLGKSSYKFNAEVENEALNVDVESQSWGIMIYSNVRLDIYIPSHYANEIKIKTVSGDVTLDDLSVTKVDINTTSGDVELHDTHCDTSEILTVSGDIDLSNYKGALDINTTSGDVETDFSGDKFSYDVDINTVSGDVELELPEGSTFDLDIDTVSGDRHNELGFDPDSDYKIAITTVSGDIELTD